MIIGDFPYSGKDLRLKLGTLAVIAPVRPPPGLRVKPAMTGFFIAKSSMWIRL
jgi:hypothetical protein